MESLDSIDTPDTPVLPRSAGCPVPLTAPQLQIWNGMIKQGTRLSNMRLVVTSVRILGPLSGFLLRQSLDAIVQRHESLRTRIVSVDGTPRQHIDKDCECRLEVVDLTAIPSKDIEGEAKRLVQEFIDAKIDLSVGPLFEGRLLRLSDGEHVLVLAIDHIVSDAVSSGILSRELWYLYNQAAQGRPFSLPQLPVQFADYAVWQQRTSNAWLKEHEGYWRGRLTGAPRTAFPRDDGFDSVKNSIATLHYPFGKALTTSLRNMATRERTRLSSVVLTVYVEMISRLLSQQDLVLSFVSHGRYLHPELEHVIGFLANHMFLRIEIAKRDSHLDLLKRVNLELHSAYQHYDYGRVPQLFPECISEVGFNWLPVRWTEASGHRAAATATSMVRIQQFPTKTSWPVGFYVFFSETSAGLCATVAYRTDLFAKRTVDFFGHELRLFATEFGRRPLASIASVAPSS